MVLLSFALMLVVLMHQIVPMSELSKAKESLANMMRVRLAEIDPPKAKRVVEKRKNLNPRVSKQQDAKGGKGKDSGDEDSEDESTTTGTTTNTINTEPYVQDKVMGFVKNVGSTVATAGTSLLKYRRRKDPDALLESELDEYLK